MIWRYKMASVSKSEIDKNSNEIIKKRKKNIYEIVKNITKYLNEAIDNVKKVMLESIKNQTIKDWKHGIGNKTVIDTNIDDIIASAYNVMQNPPF